MQGASEWRPIPAPPLGYTLLVLVKCVSNIESTLADLIVRYDVISAYSGVSLIEEVKALLVNFVLRVAFTDTARPFDTLVHNAVTN
jgi:hypothetical protein